MITHTYAQLLADVNGDGEQELVLGGLDGSLAIFKVRMWALTHRSIRQASAAGSRLSACAYISPPYMI